MKITIDDVFILEFKKKIIFFMEGKMSNYLIALKDVLVVLSPMLIAYIDYRSNKKTEKDIRLEIEKSL